MAPLPPLLTSNFRKDFHGYTLHHLVRRAPHPGLLGGGWFLAGKFKIEVKTYEIVITRVVLPCFVFFNLYQVPPTASDLLLLPAALLLTAILFVLSALLAKGLSQEPSLRQAICGMASCPNVCYLGGVLTYLTFPTCPLPPPEKQRSFRKRSRSCLSS